MIQVTKKAWDKIHKDYKGGKKGERSVFAGCIQEGGGTTLLKEGEHFEITGERR